MTGKGEQGVALVITLFLMGAMSALAVSMMFLAHTETSASRNYRTMSQARYAGEAGVHRALNYLSSTAYSPTVASLASFDTSVSPVTFGGNPVVLAPIVTNSNHPDSAVKSAYAALFTGASLNVGGGATVSYAATATLLSARAVNVYGAAPSVVQTWRISATGNAGPSTLPATVEVAAVLERDSVAAETYAVFATGDGCGAVTLAGGVTTDSYDSTDPTSMATTPPTTQPHSGAVGTNGNVSLSGSVAVNGNVDTPRTGVGNCKSGNPNAFSGTGSATHNGSLIQLPQPKVYPTPTAPTGVPTSGLTINSSTTCLAFLLTIMAPVDCDDNGGTTPGNITLTANGGTIALGNVAMSGGATLKIVSGTTAPVALNVNTFSMAGGSSLVLDPGVPGATPSDPPVVPATAVVMNVAGQSVSTGATVVDFTGGSVTNASYDPSKFQILYAGPNKIKAGGSSDTAATIYAPNADVLMHGSAGFYGSVLGKSFTDNGGAKMHYDRSLAGKYSTLGHHVMSSFSWQKY
jgi:Tfp pilus assembly protein PilX